MSTGRVTKLRGGAGGARIPSGRLAQPQSIGRWLRSSTVGVTPARLAAVISSAERGDLEDWADTAEAMLRDDPHLRSVYETFIRSVISAELRFEPADDSPEAQRAADFCAEAWDAIRGSEVTLEHLLHAEGVWAGVVEHDWKPARTSLGTAWLSVRQFKIPVRDVKLDQDWVPMVRTWEGGLEKWLRVDEEPNAWIAHVPGGVGLPPQLAGALMACAWSWLFKKWAVNFRQQGLERFASPIAVGKSDESASSEARAAFLSALEDLSANGAIVLEGAQELTLEGMGGDSSGASQWQESIRHMEDEMTKAILGSTLNVEVGDTGGNRALGESQFSTTILPRLQAAAKRLAETLRDWWVRPTLEINARLFGGVPPLPEPVFGLEQEEAPVITQMHVDAKVVTANELRASANLEAWEGPEGQRIVEPAAQPGGGLFSQDEGQEVGKPAAPFARIPAARRQLPLPLTSTPRTSPTSSDSQTRTSAVPFPPSGGPARPR